MFIKEDTVDYGEICPGTHWREHDESVEMFNKHMDYNTNPREVFVDLVEENN